MDYSKRGVFMAVPESVRKVERPVNTIVEDSGRDTMYRYAVRERGEIVYESGSNPRPKVTVK